MQYLTNDEVVTVGLDWLYQHLPREVEIYARYRPLEGDAPITGEWQKARKRKHDWAYNLDEPPLAEARPRQ